MSDIPYITEVSCRLKLSSVVHELDEPITTPNNVYSFVKNLLQDLADEQFILINLDTRNRPINYSVIAIGNINTAHVDFRSIMKVALLSNANAILVAHSHPSGCARPSSADYNLSQRLMRCGYFLNIPLIDHVIIGCGSNERYSLLLDDRKKYDEMVKIARAEAETAV